MALRTYAPAGQTYGKNASTSERLGIDSWAPARVVERAAAAWARSIDWGRARPSASPAASAPLKASPAARVETGAMSKAG